jgi:RNA polymerase sigma factor (sigma-70 family)
MAISTADQLLLDQIRQGDQQAWADLVNRFQGRLFAFARSRVRDAEAAEDIIQETFIACLRGLKQFRGDSGLETFLFTICRRKIIDRYRGRRVDICSPGQALSIRPGDDDEASQGGIDPAAPVTGASWYARGQERHQAQSDALAEALGALIAGYRDALDFQNLKTLELMFYCGASPTDIARLLEVPNATIRTFRHRCIKRLRQRIGDAPGAERVQAGADAWRTDEQAEAILRRVWRSGRLSCPKRSTIGAYHLDTLEADWADYVRFHLEQLGCQYCQASLEDLRTRIEADQRQALVDRVLNSTVGFLKGP